MHAAGIKFNDPLFIGQPAQANAVVCWIVLRTGHHQNCRVECVAAFRQVLIGPVKVSKTVVRAHDDRLLPSSRARRQFGTCDVFFACGKPASLEGYRERTDSGRSEEFTARDTHCSPPLEIVATKRSSA